MNPLTTNANIKRRWFYHHKIGSSEEYKEECGEDGVKTIHQILKKFWINKKISFLHICAFLGFIMLAMVCVLVFLKTTKKRSSRPFLPFAVLLTNPDQSSEGSYGWYREQLKKNKLGNTEFEDPILTKLGFQETGVTGKDMFYYFSTFDTKKNCLRQQTCTIYADRTAGDVIESGILLDAVLVHCSYKPPFYLNTLTQQDRNFDTLHSIIASVHNETKMSLIDQSNQVDLLYGEKMWRGMRRLSIYMCSEAIASDIVNPFSQNSNNHESMTRFSNSPADISICFLSTCSVWVNYLYYPIKLSDNSLFGSKKLKKNSGICAFISNCGIGAEAKKRYEVLTILSQYLPVKQYGRCGKNSHEGPEGKQFELENNCKFYFAAENTISKDYVTEKFFEGAKALQNGARMLMIYRGAPNIKEWGFPASMFINTEDFKSAHELGEYLKTLNDKDDEFEKRFAAITDNDRMLIDKGLEKFDYRLGANIPCRICKIIGEMKLARYLLFKIGLHPSNYKVNYKEWDEFRQRFEALGKERMKILDEIYQMAFNIVQFEGNYLNSFNLGWKHYK